MTSPANSPFDSGTSPMTRLHLVRSLAVAVRNAAGVDAAGMRRGDRAATRLCSLPSTHPLDTASRGYSLQPRGADGRFLAERTEHPPNSQGEADVGWTHTGSPRGVTGTASARAG